MIDVMSICRMYMLVHIFNLLATVITLMYIRTNILCVFYIHTHMYIVPNRIWGVVVTRKVSEINKKAW